MPGFLEGKLYADFRDSNKYNDSLLLVITRLGLSAPRDEQLSKKIESHHLPEAYERPILLAALILAAILLGSFSHSALSLLPHGVALAAYHLFFAVSYTLPSALSRWERFLLATTALGMLNYSRHEVLFLSEWSFLFSIATGAIVSWAWCSMQKYSRVIGSFLGFLAANSIASSTEFIIYRLPDVYQSDLYGLFKGFYVLLIWSGIIIGDLIVVNKSHTIQTIYRTHRLENR